MSHSTPLPIGQIITTPQVRDAIHVAVAPVYAAQRLKPGQRVALDDKGAAIAAPVGGIGIVDPFLGTPVKPNQQFWLFVDPYTVTSLSHAWSHPAFPDKEPEAPIRSLVAEAMARIEEDAENAGIEYDELIDAAEGYLSHGSYLCDGGRWEGHGLRDGFWDDYQIVKGVSVPEGDRGSFFTCSC